MPIKREKTQGGVASKATAQQVKQIRQRLTAAGSHERAVGAKAYLKSELEFLGVTVPELRKQVKAYAKQPITKAELEALVASLWSTKVNELRSFAIGLLERHVKELDAGDLPWLVQFSDDADTWAHVDWLATKVIGPCVNADPKSSTLLRRWAKHENFWVRRTAILALHDPLSAGKGNFELLEELAVPMLHEREFFIRKAIGWLLRAAAKRKPELTIGFVERHASKMSGLSFREATRNLPAATRTRLERLREAAPIT